MTLFTTGSTLLDRPCVSIDLETTGLSPDDDEIIEVGAVKFQGNEVLETYHTLVNPYRSLSEFIKRLTGITQREIDRAPSFAIVAGEIASFISDLPIVGHNVGFDLGFLEKRGIRLTNPRCDTWDMASILLPQASEYSLIALASSLDIPHPRPHRALPDAMATKELFLRLVERALGFDLGVISALRRFSSLSQWDLSFFLRDLEQEQIRKMGNKAREVGPMGLGMDSLKKRVHTSTPLPSPRRKHEAFGEDFLTGLMGKEGGIARLISGYEERLEQLQMIKAVNKALDESHHLIVEGGTGIGKSWAYLLPAILQAYQSGRPVVVSTNTINLQEQLLDKDIPTLLRVLEQAGHLSPSEFRFTSLKGRNNYLCWKRWSHLQNGESLSQEEARFCSKLLIWLQSTSLGDRGELNLAPRGNNSWSKVTAEGAPDCPASEGICFLRASRDRANHAHLVVVNHALLLSDLALGGGLIPDYDSLIIDEAHHLEEEATRHFGFDVGQEEVEEHLQSLWGQRGLIQEVEGSFRGSLIALPRRETVLTAVANVAGQIPRAKENLEATFQVLNSFIQSHRGGDERGELGITSSMRIQPGWSKVEVAWDNTDASLSEVGRELEKLRTILHNLEDAQLLNYEGLMLEISRHLQLNNEITSHIREVILSPRSDYIYWLSQSSKDGTITMWAAPLHVGEELEKRLFSQKKCVVLTGATLSTDGNFQHMKERLGLTESQELLLGSPFDYPKAALLCLPQDMPEPTSWAYQQAMERGIAALAQAAQGRTMVLFTSHAALRATCSALRPTLEAQNIQLLAQGVDGNPRQILRSFLDNPGSVLLGTSSFWEGVDLAGEALKVLVLARLPFNVPTEPVFAARSALYDNPFNQYALPQAVLRFRQGFGRLIRTKSDKGVVVVLDRRITSKPYGASFLNSIPPCTVTRCSLREMAGQVARWIGR